MQNSRRQFLRNSASAALVTGLTARGLWANTTSHSLSSDELKEVWNPGIPNKDYRPVVTPNGVSLPFKVINGVKVFHLIPEEVSHEFASGLKAECWGYNGRVHGPTIEAVEGDRVRIYVTNKLPAPTTIHWHGVLLPNGMDGVGGLTQRPIEPGETFKYEFTLRQYGTLMYHSHHDEMTQMALGQMGMFVIHPRKPSENPPDRDFVYLLSEWRITPGARRPDPNEMMDFNVFTFNAKVFPDTDPLVVRKGERVRIRIGNLSAMDHHPIHLHGHHFRIVETDGGVIPEPGQWPESSVLVPVGSTRTVEFIADNPGDWALHCHMTHHVMTQMGHGIPNLVGVNASLFDEKLAKVLPSYLASSGNVHGQSNSETSDVPKNSIAMEGGSGPFGYVTMGGMVTVLKVREKWTEGTDAGWYAHPKGTVADVASLEEMNADGIEPGRKP